MVRERTFYSCLSLDIVTFETGSTLHTLEKSGFAHSSLKSICLPHLVGSLGDCCFEWCLCLASFGYGSLDMMSPAFGKSNLRSIGCNCFSNSGLMTFKIPNCVTTLGAGSFHSCRLLEKVTFEQDCHLKEIPELCFACCGFESIVIPKSIETLGKLSFFSSKVKQVSFENNSKLHQICELCFQSSMLSDIRYPPAATVHVSAFIDTTLPRNAQVHRGFITNGDSLLVRYVGAKSDPSIDQQFVQIGTKCFEGSQHIQIARFQGDPMLRQIADLGFFESSLEAIELPSRVECLGQSCFSRCTSLKTVRFHRCSKLREIGKSCFAGSALMSIIIPAQVKVLSESCFAGCQSLATCRFAQGALLKTIERRAFQGSGLCEIVVPEMVEVLGPFCFSVCRWLTKMRFEEGSRLRSVCEFAFGYSPSLGKLFLPVSVRTISPSAFANGPTGVRAFVFNGNWVCDEKEERIVGYSGRGRSVVPNGIVAVSHSCLLGCLSVTKVDFESPSKVVHFDDLAFSKTSLRRVVVPRSVRRIGHSVFARCRSLELLAFDKDSELVEIGSSCFEDCSLENLLVPRNVKSIGSS
jgi:hypothetical protein